MAQLVFAAFLLQPGNAKDKKTSLFKYANDGTEVNKDYSKIFHYEEDKAKRGIIFQKTNKEIDEVLFIAQLYKDAKKHLKDDLVKMKLQLEKRIEENLDDPLNSSYRQTIATITTKLEINNTCMFYAISLFYAYKGIGNAVNGVYDFENYYRKSEYHKEIIKEFANFYLERTIDIIKGLVPDGSGVNNWVRNPNNQDKFMEKVNERIIMSDERERHGEFMEKFLLKEM